MSPSTVLAVLKGKTPMRGGGLPGSARETSHTARSRGDLDPFVWSGRVLQEGCRLGWWCCGLASMMGWTALLSTVAIDRVIDLRRGLGGGDDGEGHWAGYRKERLSGARCERGGKGCCGNRPSFKLGVDDPRQLGLTGPIVRQRQRLDLILQAPLSPTLAHNASKTRA